MKDINTLLNKISNSKDLDFGTIFSNSFELFKKTWLQGFLFVLISILVMLPLILALYLPFIGMMIAQSEDGYSASSAISQFFTGMSILYIIFVIIAIFALSAISFALEAGFFRVIKKLDYNEPTKTSDIFYFFKAKYFSKTFIIMLASFGISILALMLCYFPIFYVMVPLSFLNVIFSFNPELTTGEIVKASFKLGNKKWLLTFGLLFVSGLLAEIVGLLMCGIGILFTVAFVYHPTYLIYKDVIGFDEEHVIDEIGNTVE
ncbi:hypothetical protein [Yeosuana marina]|uniref:hypothetical protein n=1 Tax=Yeosuana marina TaxID=1565536 RepID=UPI0030ED6E47|tara:strand:- start:5338 stop:6120 length:783 start_codon:yes stop_codon:yes gene_type:complete